MEKSNEEKIIKNFPNPVTIEGTEKILEQMKKCICKIKYNGMFGTGFFYKNNKLPVLITNFHVIIKKYIEEKKEKNIILNDDKEVKIINLENKKIYLNEKYDISIIEIKNNDNITNYLELDDNLFIDNSKILYEGISIYNIQYPNGNKVLVSYGILNKIDNYNIYHFCNTEFGSSGSPLLNLSNNKVIGIHKGRSDFNFNIGTFIKFPIYEFINNNFNEKNRDNKIKMELKIEKEDINEDIYFLDNSHNYKDEDENTHNYLKELNESNVELYIDDIKYKYQKYFRPEKEGLYNIKLKLNIKIKDCSYMFFGCEKLTNIDLTSFNTKNVINMENMFAYCSNLKSIDLSSFDTKNVVNMKFMFNGCNKLTNINLSSFETKNVINMEYMFYECENLMNIDLSSFETNNVINMESMFYECKKLTSIDLSSFNTENVINMEYMFYECENLSNINLFSFNIKNVTNIESMFAGCNNLKNIKINIKEYENIKKEIDFKNIEIVNS